MPPDVRVAQRNMFQKQSSKNREETNDNDHDVSVKAFSGQNRIQEYIFSLVQNIIQDSLIVFMEQYIPTNYKEAMVELSTRYDYES